MGLIAWYKMDGDVTDSSGNGKDASSANTSYVDGKIGQALEFNGTNATMTLPRSQYFAVPQMSIAFWINADSYSSYRGVFYISDNLSNYLILRQQSNTIRMMIEDGNVLMVNAITPSLSSYIDTWVHLAFTQDGSGWKFYIHGVETTLSGTNSGYCSDHITISNGIFIGISSWVEQYLDGTIDDFRLYDYALTTYEVKQLAMAKIAHWKLDVGNWVDP